VWSGIRTIRKGQPLQTQPHHYARGREGFDST